MHVMVEVKKGQDRGFTLIELLVVIAIIGILASVVLSSLSSARQNANDAAIKQMTVQLASQAELYRLQNTNLAGLRRWLIGRDGNGTFYSCTQRGVQSISPFGPEFLNLCESIVEKMPTFNHSYMYWGYRERVGSGNYVWMNNNYAFLVRLNNGQWFCVNGNGVRKQGHWSQVVPGCRDVTL